MSKTTEERIKERKRKEIKCYEKYLLKARKSIKPEDVPEDIDGSLYQELMYRHTMYTNDFRSSEPWIVKELEERYNSSHIKLFLLLCFVPLVGVAMVLRQYNSILAAVMMFVCLVISLLIVTWGDKVLDNNLRLRTAAECKAICEILEKRRTNHHPI